MSTRVGEVEKWRVGEGEKGRPLNPNPQILTPHLHHLMFLN